MATSSKKTGAAQKKPFGKSEADPYAEAQYKQLRTMLDSLEIGALRYYLNNTSESEKKKRFEELYSELMPIIHKLWSGKSGHQIACPPGYTNCDGCCVPYDC